MRTPHDAYYTNVKVTEALLKRFQFPTEDVILEPCCGAGNISDTLKGHGHTVIATDLYQPNQSIPSGIIKTFDATSQDYWDYFDGLVDWVVTNPPFTFASSILPKAFTTAKKGVVMLLRLSYLEPAKDRAEWLQQHPLYDLMVLNPRPSFTDDGKCDSVTTAWFVWLKEDTTHTKITYINDWK